MYPKSGKEKLAKLIQASLKIQSGQSGNGLSYREVSRISEQIGGRHNKLDKNTVGNYANGTIKELNPWTLNKLSYFCFKVESFDVNNDPMFEEMGLVEFKEPTDSKPLGIPSVSPTVSFSSDEADKLLAARKVEDLPRGNLRIKNFRTLEEIAMDLKS